MKLEVVRYEFYEDRTLGIVYIDDKIFCHSLEDKVRPDGIKVYGETAIPEGTYDITIEPFRGDANKMYPLLHDVPNFTGICMHGGNVPADTLGCVLLGFDKDDATHTISSTAVKTLVYKLQASPKPYKVTIRNG